MNQKRLEEISQALTARGIDRPCPRCGNLQFSIVAEFAIVLEESPSSYTMGGRSIPTVIVACDKCGYIAQHALAALDLARWAKP
jgi:ribosomal protein S27AE